MITSVLVFMDRNTYKGGLENEKHYEIVVCIYALLRIERLRFIRYGSEGNG